MVDLLLDLGYNALDLVGPTLVAMLVVPLFGLLKTKVLPWLGGLPAVAQRILVLVLASGLTWLGTALNVALPTDLSLFAEADVGALLSASLAWSLHAWGKKGEGG